MTELQPPYEPGDELTDDTGIIWKITGVSREYTIEKRDGEIAAEEQTPETVYYPEDSLQSKIERGELTDYQTDMVACPYCDYQAPGDVELTVHLAEAHDEPQDETEE